MKTCCDYECAEANDCMVGGIECKRCGDYFCSHEIREDGLCDECAEAKREEEREADNGDL